MFRSVALILLLLAVNARLYAQDLTQQPPSEKRGWFSRILHPFHTSAAPNYKDPRLRGLLLDLKLSPQPVKLSEVRQLEVKLTLTNVSKRAVTLEFSSDQRVEIYLRNSTETILTKWSDNHAFNDDAATVLVNPEEHINYSETIATRDLTPNRVFIAEVFFPEYPELRIRQKFMTAP